MDDNYKEKFLRWVDINKNDLMDIEQQIEKILSKQEQLEITNKRLHQWLQNSVKEIRNYHEKRIEQVEGNIRKLGERIGNLEKQAERTLLNQSPDKD